MAQADEAAGVPAARRRKAAQKVVTALMLLAVAAVLLPATTFLFLAGMVPTAVSVATERAHKELAALSIAPLNLVGIVPAAAELWRTERSLDDAVTVLLNPFSLIYILGASAVGWACYHGFPPLIEAVLTYRGQRVLRKAREAQQRLLSEWGDSVTELKPAKKRKAP